MSASLLRAIKYFMWDGKSFMVDEMILIRSVITAILKNIIISQAVNAIWLRGKIVYKKKLYFTR